MNGTWEIVSADDDQEWTLGDDLPDLSKLPRALTLALKPRLLCADGSQDLAAERLAFARTTAGELHVLGAYLLAILATGVPHPLHQAIARAVLTEDFKIDDAASVDALARALADAASGLRRALLPSIAEGRGDRAVLRLANDAAIDGMFHYDAIAADWIERTYGEHGARYAAAIRLKSRERWEEYTNRNPLFQGLLPGDAPLFVLWVDLGEQPYPARWPWGLCSTLWQAVVRPKLDRTFMQIAPAMPLLTWQHQHDVRKAVETREVQGQIQSLNEAGDVVGRFAVPVLDQSAVELLRAGIDNLPRLTVERLLRGWSRDVFDQARRDVNPYNRLVYAGGWDGLAERYNINTKDQSLLPAIVEALYLYRGGRKDIPALVADRWITTAAPGRRAELRLDIGEALAPGFVSRLPADVRGRDRWLLPVLPEPYLFGWRPKHQALCDLQWDILILIRERAEALKAGGVRINGADVQKLADRRGIDVEMVEQALHAWSTRDDSWLRLGAPGRYTLVDEGATKLLIEAANIVANARQGGAARAALQRRPPRKKQ